MLDKTSSNFELGQIVTYDLPPNIERIDTPNKWRELMRQESMHNICHGCPNWVKARAERVMHAFNYDN